jgi:uncharacterized Zn-binding protein involved in type VI secretion
MDANYTALVTFQAPSLGTYTVWSGASQRLYVTNGTAVLSVNGEVAAAGGGMVAPGSLVSLGVVCLAAQGCAVLHFG